MREATEKSDQPTASVNRDLLLGALPDVLNSREWARAAYEATASVVTDTETATMLRRLADDVREDTRALTEALGRIAGEGLGPDKGIAEEAKAWLGRRILPTNRGAYADARYVATLYGAEAEAGLATRILARVAERLDDRDLASGLERVAERSRERLDYLNGRVEDLGELVFAPEGAGMAGRTGVQAGSTENRPLR